MREAVGIRDTFRCFELTEATDPDYYVCPFLRDGLCQLGKSSGYKTSPHDMTFKEALMMVPLTCPLQHQLGEELGEGIIDFDLNGWDDTQIIPLEEALSLM